MLNIKRINEDLHENSKLTILENEFIKSSYNLLIKNHYIGGNSFDLWKNDSLFIYGDVDKLTTVNSKVKPAILFERYGLNYGENSEVSALLFSIQTFYSVLIKLVAFGMVSINEKTELFDIFNGKEFKKNGLENYCYEDYYCWFLADNDLLEMASKLYNVLFEIYFDDSADISFLENDFVKQIYETVIPKEFRHILGEYYTPDWMAKYTLENSIKQSEVTIDDTTTFLDPTCGSGTFIFKALELVSTDSLLKGNVRGYDINPLAVLTSRTNYIISAIRKGIRTFNKFIIPVFCFDTINTPKLENESYIIDLNFSDCFRIPKDIFEGEESLKEIERVKTIISDQVGEFKSNIQFPDEFNNIDTNAKICILNSLENRILGFKLSKNDFVVGNPPWVNWEYLPEQYKRRSNYMWYDYGLFNAKGRDLSFSKEDISVLISYVVIDKYLKENGFLGFVIRQIMFKSASNGVAFRKFHIEGSNIDLKVHSVDDMSKVKVFDNAANATSIMFIERDKKTQYPVKYVMWEKNGKKFNSYSSLDEVLSSVNRVELIANPAIKNDPTSMWTTIDSELINLTDTILGSNDYKARTGTFTGGANAVYWVRILKEVDENHVLIENIVERAKRKADVVQAIVEKDLLYPMIQGSTIDEWSCKNNIYLLCPHTAKTKMKPIEEDIMKSEYPLTYKYLLGFKQFLDERNGFAGWEKELQKQYFYSILRIGDYTFSKYKVGWKYIATEFISCVIENTNDKFLGEKAYLLNEKVMYVSLEDETEAYYLCGILSSIQVATVIKSYMNPTSISAHVLEKVYIPTFDKTNDLHCKISEVCKNGHSAADKKTYKDELNRLVNKLYGLSDEVLQKLK